MVNRRFSAAIVSFSSTFFPPSFSLLSCLVFSFLCLYLSLALYKYQNEMFSLLNSIFPPLSPAMFRKVCYTPEATG